MSALQQSAPPESYVARLARERYERRARIAAKAYVPGPKTIEIRETPVADTKIEVIACVPQVVTLADDSELSGKVVAIEDIKAAVCRHFHVSMNDLLSARRDFKVIVPRHIGIYLSKVLTQKSLPAIGRQFGGRDHSTALNAIGRVEQLLKTSDSVREDVETLIRRLTGCLR